MLGARPTFQATAQPVTYAVTQDTAIAVNRRRSMMPPRRRPPRPTWIVKHATQPIFRIPDVAAQYRKVPTPQVFQNCCTNAMRRRRRVPSLRYEASMELAAGSISLQPGLSRQARCQCPKTGASEIRVFRRSRLIGPLFRCASERGARYGRDDQARANSKTHRSGEGRTMRSKSGKCCYF